MPKLQSTVIEKKIILFSVFFSISHLAIIFFNFFDSHSFRHLHVLLIFLSAIFFSIKEFNIKSKILSIIFFILGACSCFYILIFDEYLSKRMVFTEPLTFFQYFFGCSIVLATFILAFKFIGRFFLMLLIFFLIIGLYSLNFNFELILEHLYLTNEGFFGIPIHVSANYLVLFILFGALAEKSGLGKLIIDLSLLVIYKFTGGSAKISCIASGLFGSISGSSVANVMTTGIFTIPLMKKNNYPEGFPEGVESVASTGGQLLPPIMGASAFIMAEFLGVSYLTITKYAILPALLFYIGILTYIHFESKKLKIKFANYEIFSIKDVIRNIFLLIPIFILVFTILSGFSPILAVSLGIFSFVPTLLLTQNSRKKLKLNFFYDVCIQTTKNSLIVGSSCLSAGLIIGIIFISGIGLEITQFITLISSENIYLALFLTMMCSLILGMGMPTSPAYILQTALLIPTLISLGVNQISAHMFGLYFSVLSSITPPIALAVIAANSISGGKLMRSCLYALKIGLPCYLIPFLFVFDNNLLFLTDENFFYTLFKTVIIILSISSLMSGFFLSRLSLIDKTLLSVSLILFLYTFIDKEFNIFIAYLVFVFFATIHFLNFKTRKLKATQE